MPTQRSSKKTAATKQSPRQTPGRGGKGTRDESQRYRPRGRNQALGFARKRDIEDSASQQSAPHGPGRFDRTGEDDYAEELEKFEGEGGASRAKSAAAKPNSELDQGGVQFGGAKRDIDPRRGARPDRSR